MDKENYECYFGHGKCAIWYNNAYVGNALLHDELYLLSLREKVHSVCNVNEHVSASNKEQKKRKRTFDSSKLWHFRLGHISKGRIEILVKSEILPPLEFSDLEQCIDCTKGKYIKQIKKVGNRFRIIGTGTAADHNGVFFRTFAGQQRNPCQIQNL